MKAILALQRLEAASNGEAEDMDAVTTAGSAQSHCCNGSNGSYISCC